MKQNKYCLIKKSPHSYLNHYRNIIKKVNNKKTKKQKNHMPTILKNVNKLTKHTKAYRLLKLKRKYNTLKQTSNKHISELITALENVYQELSQTTDNPPKLYVSL